MTDQLFDNFIQDKLRDHSSAVPEGLWDKIEQGLKEDEDKKVFFLFQRSKRWYWAAAVLVLALSSAAWLLWHTPEQTSTVKTTGAAATTGGASPADDERAPVTAGSTDKVVSSEVQSQQPFANTPLSNTQSSAGNTLNNTQHTTTNGLAVTASDQAHVQQQHALSTTGSQFRNNAGVHTNKSSRTASGRLSDSHLYTDLNTQQAATAATGDSQLQDATGLLPFATLPAATILLQQRQDAAAYAAGLKQTLQAQDYKLLPVIRCPPVRSNTPSSLYIEAYLSPDKVMRQVSANNGQTGYLANRDTSLSLHTSFTAGVRLSKALTENLLLKAGLQYSQVNETFNYRLENERKTITVITTHTITNAPGDTMIVRDTSSYEQIGYLQKKVKNRYRNIDIPILLSYEWGNDQWRFAVNGGPIINIHSWYDGEMPDTLNRPVAVGDKNGSSEVFKKNIGVGVYAGFSIIRSISENVDVFAEPYFRYNVSDMTQKGQAFNQKLNTAGLSLGVRYRIGGGQRY